MQDFLSTVQRSRELGEDWGVEVSVYATINQALEATPCQASENDLSVLHTLLSKVVMLRELHPPTDLSVSLGWPETRSTHCGQYCVLARARGHDHVGSVTLVHGWRAVPPHLSHG